LPGTIHSAAEEVCSLGGDALPIVCDVRNEQQVQAAIDQVIAKWGRIDIVVNNASAISLSNTEETPIKRYDLMNQVNARGTYLLSQLALPHLKQSSNPHILNLSPPLSFEARWFEPHVAYTIAKFGMSMCVMGMAAEFSKYGIAVNALWPRTAIDTAALAMIRKSLTVFFASYLNYALI
jgi:citronellol/citronellal dehydrogenase